MLRGIVQFDTLNEVNIRLSDGSKAFNYDGYTNIIFKVLKADGTAYIDSEGENVIATSPVDGIITVNLAGQSTTAAGLCQSVLEIYSGDGKMTTARFNYEVFENLDLDEDAIVSEPEYPVLQKLVYDLSMVTAEDIGALPVSGGTLTGDVVIKTEEYPQVVVMDSSGKDSVGYGRLVKSFHNDILYIDNNANGELSRIIFAPYKNGVSDILRIGYLDRVHKIFGEHNKTSGTYIGNGDERARTIDTEGVGGALLVTSVCGTVLATSAKSFIAAADTDSVVSMNCDKVCFNGGILTIATADSCLNESGVVYNYQVL